MIIVVTLQEGVSEAQAQSIVRKLGSTDPAIARTALYNGMNELVGEQAGQMSPESALPMGGGPMSMGGVGSALPSQQTGHPMVDKLIAMRQNQGFGGRGAR